MKIPPKTPILSRSRDLAPFPPKDCPRFQSEFHTHGLKIELTISGRKKLFVKHVMGNAIVKRIASLLEISTKGVRVSHFAGSHAKNGRELLQQKLTRYQRYTSAQSTESAGQNFGYLLRLRRASLGLTQVQLAAKVKMSRTHLSALEHGKHVPTASMQRRLYIALKLKPDAESAPFLQTLLDSRGEPSDEALREYLEEEALCRDRIREIDERDRTNFRHPANMHEVLKEAWDGWEPPDEDTPPKH